MVCAEVQPPGFEAGPLPKTDDIGTPSGERIGADQHRRIQAARRPPEGAVSQSRQAKEKPQVANCGHDRRSR